MTALSPEETRRLAVAYSTLDRESLRVALYETWFEIHLTPEEFVSQVNSVHPQAAREVYRRVMRQFSLTEQGH